MVVRLLLTPHSLVVRHRKIKLGLSWKLFSIWLVLMVQGMIVKLLRKKSHPWFYSAVDTVHYNTNLQDRPTSVIVVRLVSGCNQPLFACL